MKTFNAGDRVVITGWPELVYGEITGNTWEFEGVTHYYVIIPYGSCEGLICHPDGLRLVKQEAAI